MNHQTGIVQVVDNLPYLLQWECSDKILFGIKKLREIHMEYIVRRLHVLLSKTVLGTHLLVQLQNLENSSLIRIIEAPETCYIVNYTSVNNTEKLERFIEDSIAAEMIRSHKLNNHKKSLWTALGDYYFPDNRKSIRYQAPIFQNIIVDLSSPYANRDLIASSFRPNFGHAILFENDELKRVLFLIYAAINGIYETNKFAYYFTSMMIRTIMPRKDDINYTFKGSSNIGMIGRINLYNPHIKSIDHSVIATSLIHEAIHTCLYLCEEQIFFARGGDIAFNSRIRSPWSNKLIDLNTFIHATFVWFGLYYFWVKEERLNHFTNKMRKYYIGFCKRGFIKRAALKKLENYRKYIHSDVYMALENMQRIIDLQ